MSPDFSTIVGRERVLLDLIHTVGPSLKASQVEQVLMCLHAGEWQLSLEFLTDFIIDEEVKISSETFATIATLAEALLTDRGIDYIRDNLVV